MASEALMRRLARRKRGPYRGGHPGLTKFKKPQGPRMSGLRRPKAIHIPYPPD